MVIIKLMRENKKVMQLLNSRANWELERVSAWMVHACICGVTNGWPVNDVTFKPFRAVSQWQLREDLATPLSGKQLLETDRWMGGWTHWKVWGWLNRNCPATYVHLNVQHDPLVLFYMDAPDTVLAFVIGLGPVRRENHSCWIGDLATTHSCEKHIKVNSTSPSCRLAILGCGNMSN